MALPATTIAHLPRSSPLEDAELVRAVLAGDRDAFAVLMRRYNQRVFRVARAIMKSDADAEDAAQDAWVTAFEKLEQLATPAAFPGWICRIASNGALLRLRRSRTLRGIIERDELTATLEHAPQPGPDDSTHRAELRAVLEAAVDRLPDIYRVVLVLRDVESISGPETAAILELDPATVRVRLHRARRMMREQLEPSTVGLFAFDGARCDRIVAWVFDQLASR